MNSRKKEYALYKGEEILAMGTIEEIGIKLDISPNTVRFYLSKAYARRSETKEKRVLVCIGYAHEFK